MKDGTKRTLCYVINLCFALYYIILAAERLDSLIISMVFGELFPTRYMSIVHLALMASVVGTAVFLFVFRDRISFTLANAEKSDYTILCAASGIILVSGMLHTEYSATWLQFVAYGILIIGIIIKAVMLISDGKDSATIWISVAYIVAFSMAIPVVYESSLEYADAFHIVEGIAMIANVTAFAFLLISFFGGAEKVFGALPIAAAAALDAAVIAMRWQESKNYFVLVFICLAIILFGIGKAVVYTKKRQYLK